MEVGTLVLSLIMTHRLLHRFTITGVALKRKFFTFEAITNHFRDTTRSVGMLQIEKSMSQSYSQHAGARMVIAGQLSKQLIA